MGSARTARVVRAIGPQAVDRENHHRAALFLAMQHREAAGDCDESSDDDQESPVAAQSPEEDRENHRNRDVDHPGREVIADEIEEAAKMRGVELRKLRHRSQHEQ